MSRSAVILRISIAKRHVDAGTYSPSTTNEKRKTYAQRDFLKCEQFQPEHQAPKRYIEVGMIDLHRIPESYIPVNRGSLHFPAAADNPGWMRWSPVNHASVVPWRRRAPQSPSPSSFGAPQGNNKIYRSDEVFLIGETQNKRQKPNAVSL